MSNTIAIVGIKYLPDVPVDERAVLYVFSDGSVAPAASFAYLPTNSGDGVSPQRGTDGFGIPVDNIPVGILHAYPNDLSRTPGYWFAPPGP